MSNAACLVCFEEVKVRLALPELKTGNGDIFRSTDCHHPVCQTCVASFVVARVEEQRVFGICCPAEGCRTELHEQDVKHLVENGALDPAVRDKFIAYRSRDYTERARGFAQTMMKSGLQPEDYDVLRSLWQSTRLCPRCSLTIQKSGGCNSFYCICGHHFNYESAPRAVGEGIKNFGRVISLAEWLRIPVDEAQRFSGDWKLYFKAHRTAAALGLDLEEARELHVKACEGDEIARTKIRIARQAHLGGA